MEKLKTLLQNNAQVWLEVKQKDFKKILNFAKENNYKWVNGKEINPKDDLKNMKTTALIGFSQNKYIGFISAMCWHFAKDVKRLKFENL